MYDAPRVIVFDVNETLSDLTALSTRFTDVGVPAHVAQLWFSSVLREGFALTAVDASQPFATIGREVLRDLLDETTLNRSMDEAVEHILSAFTGLPVHPDVVDGGPCAAGGGTVPGNPSYAAPPTVTVTALSRLPDMLAARGGDCEPDSDL